MIIQATLVCFPPGAVTERTIAGKLTDEDGVMIFTNYRDLRRYSSQDLHPSWRLRVAKPDRKTVSEYANWRERLE
jgi:hypothetical protein